MPDGKLHSSAALRDRMRYAVSTSSQSRTADSIGARAGARAVDDVLRAAPKVYGTPNRISVARALRQRTRVHVRHTRFDKQHGRGLADHDVGGAVPGKVPARGKQIEHRADAPRVADDAVPALYETERVPCKAVSGAFGVGHTRLSFTSSRRTAATMTGASTACKSSPINPVCICAHTMAGVNGATD